MPSVPSSPSSPLTVEDPQGFGEQKPRPQIGPQEKAIRASFVTELLFGGARGGGKTWYLLLDYAADVLTYGRHWRGVLFRHTYPELDEVVEMGKQIFYVLFPGTEFKVGKYEFRFPNGANLRLRHLSEAKDADHYQGHSYPIILWDELPNWPNDSAYRKLKACLRSAHPIPNKRIRCTGNPGGVGHSWVKEYYQIPKLTEPDGQLIETREGTRMFIRSLVWDNRILIKNDPNYIERLYGVGDENLVRAWLSGDWDSFVGQFFTSWHNEKIACESFEVPDNWPLYGAMDYGEAAPTAFLLATVDYDSNVYIVSEYYQKGMAASQHAENIRDMIAACPFTKGRLPDTIYADPSMWTKRRLTEVVQHSPADVFSDYDLFLTAANNDRITGWRIINDYLVKNRLRVFNGWGNHLMASMPALPRSERNAEDVDTFADDHQADALRYMLAHVYQPFEHSGQNHRHPYLGANVLNGLKKSWYKQKKRTILAA
jgi:hypothetical protein